MTDIVTASQRWLHPNPPNLRIFYIAWQRGIKITNPLTLKQRDYLERPDVIPRVFKYGEEESSVRTVCVRARLLRMVIARFEMERGPEPRNVGRLWK